MLQLREKTSTTTPLHFVPPKFWIGSVVCGGTNLLSLGNWRSSEVTPFSNAADVVMTLKLDPGMYRSWYALASNGFPGTALRKVNASWANLELCTAMSAGL